ncbi:hypothetical protein SAMN04488067_101506 [Halorubrum xinjiangense]|uniref:Pyridoxamine 5'-phosphate oxidase n=1 Tax=Halorubrum xinjiangense TaxID=261291 RepID=A0A1G7HSV6_9EURY|nr:pyridoxamine 5'-phosphate oxidase family protein [Halorubrum xinjiangense]SDF03581.1 hypothetical protein SAMN04488067_101506 [Halorubrum xinjiangense]
MPTNSEVEMSEAEVDAHLSRHETGVLALARDDAPYAIPISYGYDADERALYLRLVSTPDSEKREFLASTPRARVVVYEDENDEYASVVGVGTLERVDLDELTPKTIAQYGEARRPLFEIWADDKPDLDISLYRFTPETLTGRTVVVERDEE